MTENEMQFLRRLAPGAQASMRASGVPASITLAQAILESGWGATALAVRGNNYFGIKAEAHAKPDAYIELPTHEYVHGQRVLEEAEFARYLSPADSFTAHARLLATAPRYAPAMAARNDPAAFAAALESCGYSTNPNYAAELMELVREFNLTQYDRLGAPPALQSA